MKKTSIAPANIAFIKYWGKKDDELNLPYSDTISMNLNNCTTKTTVEFHPSYQEDSLSIFFDRQRIEEVRDEKKKKNVFTLIDKIRKMAKISQSIRIVSENSFPSDAGIAASASAFAALTLAATAACGVSLSQKDLSTLARLGSGSACRSIPSGFVIWEKGHDHESSYARMLYPPSYWRLCDIVAVVDPGLKEYSSTEGHSLAPTSEFFVTRLKNLPKRIKRLKESLKNKNFNHFGEVIEEEARSMHAIALSSQIPIVYWNNDTKKIISLLLALRKKGVFGYYTMDAGPNVHVICQEKDSRIINNELRKLEAVKKTIINHPCKGAYLTKEHLF